MVNTPRNMRVDVFFNQISVKTQFKHFSKYSQRAYFRFDYKYYEIIIFLYFVYIQLHLIFMTLNVDDTLHNVRCAFILKCYVQCTLICGHLCIVERTLYATYVPLRFTFIFQCTLKVHCATIRSTIHKCPQINVH